VVSFFLVVFVTLAQATEPVDSIVKNAVIDIERYEKQASGLTPERKSNALRILKLMNLSYERLQGSKNQTDPSWIEVNQRYISLQAKLEGLMNPESKSAESVESPVTTAVEEASKSAAPVEDKEVRPLVSGERVRVKKLARDIQNVSDSLVTTGPSTLQAADEVDARQKRLKQFNEALLRYPQLDDPDVVTARKKYSAYREKLIAEFNRAKEQLAALGNVQVRLATISENARKYSVPAPLQPPFGQADAKEWVAQASNARTVAEHNLKELAQMAPIAYLPETRGTPEGGAAYDAGDLERLQRQAAVALRDVEANYQSMAEDLSRRLAQIESDVLTRWQEDPSEESKRWLFIAEGSGDEANKLYDESTVMAQSSVWLERALGREPTEALKVIAKIQAAREAFVRKQEIALKTSRLPKPAAEDKKRMAIAKKILENPDYEFGEFAKIVLTTKDIVERERKDSEIEIDDAEITLGGDLKMSGTETTWTYKWTEFKFATALKETDSDEWYIWWITAKNYSSGGPRTPLNQWISGASTKGNRILKKNL
ncbi:MAG: hypothetical protein ACPGSB_01790, partial [Opitutales bacterium]